MSAPPEISLELFLAPPTPGAWEAELRHGWGGPDGSSCSTDAICGIRIGTTSSDFADAILPANRHDLQHQQARRYGLPPAWRKLSDAMYRDGCLERVAHLVGPVGALARARCRWRYRALRLAGWKAWRTRDSLPRWAWNGLRRRLSI